MNADQPEPAPYASSDTAEQTARTALVERLFREHNEALIRFLRARLRSYQEAREVAQDAYVRLLSLDQPGAVSYLRAFLFKTAANLAVDRMRRHEMQMRAEQPPLFDELIEGRTPERKVAGVQTLERLERVIAALPPKCRQAFVLKRFEKMDVASIADELNLSKRMVREYVARALLQCRTSLDLDPSFSEEPPHGRED